MGKSAREATLEQSDNLLKKWTDKAEKGAIYKEQIKIGILSLIIELKAKIFIFN